MQLNESLQQPIFFKFVHVHYNYLLFSAVVETNKLHRTLSSVLKKLYVSLNNGFIYCLKDVTNEMYTEGLIPNKSRIHPIMTV